jgi:hypothetical protein
MKIYDVAVEADPSDHHYFELTEEEVKFIERLGKHLGIWLTEPNARSMKIIEQFPNYADRHSPMV